MNWFIFMKLEVGTSRCCSRLHAELPALLKLVNIVTVYLLVLCIVYGDLSPDDPHSILVMATSYLSACHMPRWGSAVCPSACLSYTCKLWSASGNNGQWAPAHVSPHLISNTPSQIARCHRSWKKSWRVLLMQIERTHILVMWCVEVFAGVIP